MLNHNDKVICIREYSDNKINFKKHNIYTVKTLPWSFDKIVYIYDEKISIPFCQNISDAWDNTLSYGYVFDFFENLKESRKQKLLKLKTNRKEKLLKLKILDE